MSVSSPLGPPLISTDVVVGGAAQALLASQLQLPVSSTFSFPVGTLLLHKHIPEMLGCSLMGTRAGE